MNLINVIFILLNYYLIKTNPTLLLYMPMKF